MTILSKKGLALATMGVVALAAASSAQADVMASAMVNMTNFTIQDAGGTVLDASDFSFLTFTSSAGYTADLDGFAPLTGSSVLPSTDFPAVCVGGGCNPILPNNTFPKLTAPPGGNYAATDQLESGAPITGLGLAIPAVIANGAYVGLDSGTLASSGVSDNNLNSSFIFNLVQAGGIKFDFMADAYLQVAVTSDEIFPGFATASYQTEFSILNLSTGLTIFTYAPDLFGDLTKTLSLNAPLPVDLEITRNTGGAVGFSSTTVGLNATDLYQLSARIQVNADARRVDIPEPLMLGLMGFGLLGFGAVRQRSRKQG